MCWEVPKGGMVLLVAVRPPIKYAVTEEVDVLRHGDGHDLGVLPSGPCSGSGVQVFLR